jgi:16S rRNA (cytosine967-C5)-methyltransferase
MTRSPGIRSRRAALKILTQVREGKPFDAALDGVAGGLSSTDRRLTHELAAGVLRQRSALDQQLAPLVQREWSLVDPLLQDILRVGAYQLTRLERVPAHAAVDTSVALARRARGTRAAGFVNAVLRRLSQAAPVQPSRETGAIPALANEYSHPTWLVERWLGRFGREQTEALLRWNNTPPALIAQPARESLERLDEQWRAAGINTELARYGAGIMPARTRPVELPGYREGHFIIQDPAQAQLTRFVDPPAEAVVYDACAAPGGKTIALGRTVQVVAGEINRHRARRLAENLARAGSGREHVVVADARQPPIRAVGVVLVDAPCTGTGTFARHPDARWRVTPEALARITELQRELLAGTADLVPPGGLLVYSTCSVEPEENEIQVERFLKEHPEFHREPGPVAAPELLSARGDLRILPQLHGMDGAYAARLRHKR